LVQSGGRFRITLSNREEPLVVEAILVAKHRLKEGIVLTAPQAIVLEREAAEGACDREIARLLALRPHSIGELRAKLRRKGFEEVHATAIMKRYQQRGLLDDAHVASTLVRLSLERKPAGRSYLVALLRRKLIDRDLAEQTVEMALGDRDESELAYEALSRRRRVLFSSKQIEVETIRRRAYTYLSRRGIGYAAAKTAFERLLKETEKND
jgi:SOS response regulatory protein OraA/RecX